MQTSGLRRSDSGIGARTIAFDTTRAYRQLLPTSSHPWFCRRPIRLYPRLLVATNNLRSFRLLSPIWILLYPPARCQMYVEFRTWSLYAAAPDLSNACLRLQNFQWIGVLLEADLVGAMGWRQLRPNVIGTTWGSRGMSVHSVWAFELSGSP